MKLFRKIAILSILSLILFALLWFEANWRNAGQVIENSGIAARADIYGATPLSIAEITINATAFSAQVEKPSIICPTFSKFMPDKAKMRGMGVSGNLAVQLQMNAEPKDKILEVQFERLFVACRLERTYAQKIILKEYLSKAYFGKGEYGIDVAAQSIFGKPLEELGEQEGLALAALVRHPNFRNNTQEWGDLRDKLKGRLGK